MRTSKMPPSKPTAAKPSMTEPKSATTDLQSLTESLAETFSQARPEPALDDTARQHMVAEAAYFRAEHRGFETGHELEDWLAAEAEIVGHSLRRMQHR